MSIRLRLILLVLSVLVPAFAAALWVVGASYLNERDTLERNLRDTTRALSLVIERELARRATMAHVLSLSSLIDRDWVGFRDQATRAIDGIDGAVVLFSAHEQVVDTRRPPDQPPVYRAEPQPLVDTPTLAALAPDRDRHVLQAAALHPVKRNGRTVYNVAVTLLPQEVQRVLDEQPLPDGWFGAVLDSRGHVVASRPLGAGPIGQRADGDLGGMLQSGASGMVDVASMQGAPHIAFFSTSATGTAWTFVMAVPRAQFTGSLTRAVMPAMLGMLMLCVAGVLGALWVSRGISRPVEALSRAARELKAGEPVQQRNTRIREIDEIHATLADTGTTLRRMKSDLELQVTVAVEQARRAEQRVSQSQRVEALGRLTGGVAHDFNNLLGVISNSTHVLRRAPPGPAHEASTAAILRAVEVGSRLTQHLLRFAGRQPVRPEHLDMRSYLPRVGELVKMVVGSSIRVEIETAPDTRSTTVDSSELELALINLALNARDAMPAGGTLRMHAGNAGPGRFALSPGEYVEISVTDTGEGIEQDLVERVFEPFFTTKPTGRGTGLGLSQVHGFCRQAGGGAFVRSEVGQGTTVSMVLPAQSGRALVGGEAAPVAETEPQHAGHVLLVEDNDDLRTSTQALLRSFGYRVSHVCDGDSALRHLAADSADIDVVLSDVVMPGAVDGIALARHVMRSERPVPVVLISGFSAAVEGQREFEVLRKPCVPADLLAALRRATQSRWHEDSARR